MKFNIYGVGSGMSEAGYPAILCRVVFVKGCNFRCPFCLNRRLVTDSNLKSYNIEDVVKEIKNNNEDTISISGGEPCFDKKNLFNLIDYLRDNGLKVVLSTNGSFPDVLQELIDKDMLFFVAMDIKTSLMNYEKWKIVCPNLNVDLINRIFYSVMLLKSAYNNKKIDLEFRTTLYPPLVDTLDIELIAKELNGDYKWVLQQFRNNVPLLKKESRNIIPYNEIYMKNMLRIANQYVKNVRIRYV